MIRRAAPPDAEAIVALRERAWHRAYGDFVDVETVLALPEGDPVERWRGRLASEVLRTFVFEAAGRVAGFASAGPSDEAGAPLGSGALRALYVDPPAQGAGVGRALLAAAEGYLRERGFRRAELWVFERNEHARAFYERHGWRLDPGSRRLDPPADAYELRYERDL
ncbi:MAG TPA: GNAT family N-acetyltransferase [Solirubrobacteraceae bacterium]|nr:GNAT family N-acetyltransferase [Solirubrobacteraceae bacterium]